MPERAIAITGGDAAYTVGVHQIDAAGNISGTTSLSFTRDTTSAAPTVSLTHDTALGADNGDHITSDTSLTVGGTEAGAPIARSAFGQ